MHSLPCGRDNILVLFFVNNHKKTMWIPTKLGTKMRPYTTFLCTKFQGNQITCFHLMVTFTPWRKLSQFWKFVSWKCRFSWNFKCGLLIVEQISQQKLSSFVEAARSYSTYVKKIALFSSCQYTYGVACWLLGPHDTLPCALILLQGLSMMIIPSTDQFSVHSS